MFRAKFVTMKVVAVAALTLCLMASSGGAQHESPSEGPTFKERSGCSRRGSTVRSPTEGFPVWWWGW